LLSNILSSNVVPMKLGHFDFQTRTSPTRSTEKVRGRQLRRLLCCFRGPYGDQKALGASALWACENLKPVGISKRWNKHRQFRFVVAGIAARVLCFRVWQWGHSTRSNQAPGCPV